MTNNLHVYRGTSQRFQARGRYFGHQKYILIGKPTKSCDAACMRAVKALLYHQYKRVDVLMSTDYYEPVQVMEMVRR